MKPSLHDALQQVRELQQAILDKQRFKGYSGRARALAGCIALGAGIILGAPRFPASNEAHLIGWGVVFVLAMVLNYGALIYWFLHDPDVARDVRRLRPALEIIPVLIVGGVVTLALVHHQEYNLLFGMWMVLCGLVNFTTRQVLPRGLSWVGLYYLVCGTFCLVALPGLSFIHHSYVMGAAFFFGEFFSGLVLHFDESPLPSLRTFFGLPAAVRSEESE
ncbi:MAG TPA: hypothetical protein VHC95_01555 [Opitutales bacterium]|nr:hypothetical protein [Opitutales bacterium]